MKNTMNYSDEWQPYRGDYDKFEYDVKLKDGTIVENCYPNGGEFNSISDEHNRQSFPESEVVEIRFSNTPRFGINENVSDILQYEWLDKQKSETKKIGVIGCTNAAELVTEMEGLIIPEKDIIDSILPKLVEEQKKYLKFLEKEVKTLQEYQHLHSVYPKPQQYIRDTPKIGNNDFCSCGSGKKYKKCCKFKSGNYV